MGCNPASTSPDVPPLFWWEGPDGFLDDFAKEILKTDLSDIPVVRGDMPDTWIHGIMSAPEETKIARNTRPKIYQLDSLNTLLNLMEVDGRSVENVIGRAYEDAIRFGEHTWGFNEHVEDYEETFRNNRQNGSYDSLEASWEEKLSLADDMQNSVEPVLESFPLPQKTFLPWGTQPTYSAMKKRRLRHCM